MKNHLLMIPLAFLAACSSFRPSEDVAEEKRTGIRTMIGPIFALTQAREKAEAAAKADCFKDGRKFRLVEAMGARKAQIRYRCVGATPASAAADGHEVAHQ